MMRRAWRVVRWGVLLLLGVVVLLAVGLGVHVATHGRTPPIEDAKGQPVPGAIASLEKVRLGGVEQTVLIRGKDARAPVLLFLHGGPGMPLMSLAHRMRALEEDFVVVHWDRRGAGKSWSESLPPGSLTVEQLLSDSVELVNLLRARFHTEKVLLVGHSWGTYLGMLLAQRHPELFSAYVGVGQLAYLGEQNGRIQSAFISMRSKADGRPEALAELRANPDAAREKWLFAFGAELHDATSNWPLLLDRLRSPEYTLRDLANLSKGVALYSKHLAYNALDGQLSDRVTQVEVPVYFFTGKYDFTDPFVLTEAYFQKLHAPSKKLVWFKDSAHFPFIEEPEAFARELRAVAVDVGLRPAH